MRFARRFASFAVLSPFANLGQFQPDDAFNIPIEVCSIEGEGGGGGGGEGGGGGGGEGGGGNAPQYVTTEQLNQAISSHLGRALPKALEPLNKQFGDINTALQKLTAPKPEPTEEEKRRAAQVDPETMALKNKVTELERTANEEREKRQKAEQQQRDDSAYASLRGLVAKGNVKPEFVEFVTQNLFHAQKVVTYDENGRPLFKTRRAPFAGAAEEDLTTTLEDGVTQFLKSKEAGSFLPAPTPKNAPAQRAAGAPRLDPSLRQVENANRPRSDKEKIDRAMAKEQELLAAQNRQ